MAKKKPVYRVQFHNQGEVYELFARHVSHGEMYGFVEIAGIIFGERSAVLVDPSEEKLKSEFEGVKRTFVPMHAVIRVDEVQREGTNKVNDHKVMAGIYDDVIFHLGAGSRPEASRFRGVKHFGTPREVLRKLVLLLPQLYYGIKHRARTSLR